MTKAIVVDEISREGVHSLIQEMLELKIIEFNFFVSYVESLINQYFPLSESVTTELLSKKRLANTAKELLCVLANYVGDERSFVPSTLKDYYGELELQDILFKKHLELAIAPSVVDQFDDNERRLVKSLIVLMSSLNTEL